MKYLLKLVVIAICFSSGMANSAIAEDVPKIEHLTPPVLNSGTVLKKITCDRPMREGSVNISAGPYLSESFPKYIVNCYGHGGYGWTTLFGSVKKAIDAFEISCPEDISLMPIRVLGSGCIGLTMAIELVRRGYIVQGIFTKDMYDIASWKAGGCCSLAQLKEVAENGQSLNESFIDTFLAYQSIGHGSHPYISKEAVRFLPMYCSAQMKSGLEDLEEKGLIPTRESVVLDFGNGVRHPDFYKYMTYFIDTAILMKQLIAHVNHLGIPIEIRNVISYDEIQESVIFNCTGLGGKELNQDNSIAPFRGHLLLLNENAGTEHMNYMICAKVQQDGQNAMIAMFPKTVIATPSSHHGISCFGCLGSTFIAGSELLDPDALKRLDEAEFEKLLDRNVEFFTGKPYLDE